MTSTTQETADSLAQSASEMTYMILRKQMRAVLEEMELAWKKEHYRVGCLYGVVVQVWRCADLAISEGDGKIEASDLIKFLRTKLEEYADPVPSTSVTKEVQS